MAGFESVAIAAEAARTRGLRRDTPVYLPYLAGERTPHNDVHARGVFFGLSAGTTSADLVVAALEGVAFAFADGLDALTQAGSSIAEVTAAGGGSRMTYLLALLAAALGRPLVRRSGGEVGGAFGAARLGRLAVTGEAPDAVCTAPPIVDIVEPDDALGALVARRRPIFTALYAQLRPSFLEFGA